MFSVSCSIPSFFSSCCRLLSQPTDPKPSFCSHGNGIQLFSQPKFLTDNKPSPRHESELGVAHLGFRFHKYHRQYHHLVIHCSSPDSSSFVLQIQNEAAEARDRLVICSFLGEIGFNENETELLLERSLALNSASFESVRARVRSLQAVGIVGFELHRVVSKCPNVLVAEEVDSLLQFVLNHLPEKIEPLQLLRLLATTESRFLAGFDQKVRLLVDRGLPREHVVHVLNKVNLSKALCRKSVEEIDRTIAYLNRFGGIDIIVRRPQILNFDLNSQLVPRIELFNQLSGGNEDATGTLLRKLPSILSYSEQHVKGHVELLRSFAGLSDPAIFKILLVFPNVISVSRARKLHPRIDFLKQCGLNSEEIFKFLTKAPLFLALSFEDNLSHKLVFLVKIGYEHGTKELAVALGAVTRTSSENLQKVIGVFLSYGLSCADILAMSQKHPQILQYSCSSLEEKMNYLIEEMGRQVGELLSFPAFLGYKLDDRIKHRYEVKKKTLGEGMSINKLLSVSAESFSAKEKRKSPSLIVNLSRH